MSVSVCYHMMLYGYGRKRKTNLDVVLGERTNGRGNILGDVWQTGQRRA